MKEILGVGTFVLLSLVCVSGVNAQEDEAEATEYVANICTVDGNLVGYAYAVNGNGTIELLGSDVGVGLRHEDEDAIMVLDALLRFSNESVSIAADGDVDEWPCVEASHIVEQLIARRLLIDQTIATLEEQLVLTLAQTARASMQAENSTAALETQLAAALTAQMIAEGEAIESQRQIVELNEQVQALRTQLAEMQTLLEASR